MLGVVLVVVVLAASGVDAHGGGHHNPRSQQQQQQKQQDHHHHRQQQTSSVEVGGGQGFHDSKVVRDTEHINEHLQGKAAINISEMSLEELEFHYFKMHDFDNNTKLDGLEILKALTHLLPYEDVDEEDKAPVETHGKTPDEVKRDKQEKELLYYTEIVDNVLKDDDIDDDGYLTYPEYILARRREEARELREQMDGHQSSTQSTGTTPK